MMRRRIDGRTWLLALPLLMQATLGQAASCEDTLKQIQEFYNKTVDTCPGSQGEAQAAYNCSGLMIRGTQRPEDAGAPAGSWFVWQTSPKSREQGSIAATYMRADFIFADLAVKGEKTTNFGSGIVVEPPWLVAREEDRGYPLCGGTSDLWADERSDQGCGDNRKTGETEASCESQGVNGQNWVDRYFTPNMSQPEMIGGKTCTFDFRTMDGAKSSDQFKQLIDARHAMQNVPGQDVAFNSYPEIRYSNPKSNETKPWAFFYSDAAGRDAALKNQEEYKQQKGVDIPVIKIQYPRDKNSKASFSCDAGPGTGPVVPADNAGGWGPNGSKQCSQYFEKVEWIRRPDPGLKAEIDSVSVVPTACGREIGVDQTDAAMAEMKRKATALPGGVEKWRDRDMTLRRQLICHYTLEENGLPVRYKEAFNLEPTRSYVSHERSLRDKCNTPYSEEVTGGWGANGSKQCTQYVKSLKWVTRKFGEYGNEDIKSLEVTPTDCGRSLDPNNEAAVKAMVDEIKYKALADDERGKDYWGNKDPSMSKQTACLAKLFKNKPTWNLESKRPNELTAKQYEAAQCNPR